MLRPSASTRRVLGLALALSVGTGVGLAGSGLLSASEAPAPRAALAGATASDRPGDAPAPTAPGETSPSSALTLDEAKAVAARVAPGRVIEWDSDDEPTGLRYDVTLLHDDGSTTEVEVDTVTGEVTSTDHDDNRD